MQIDLPERRKSNLRPGPGRKKGQGNKIPVSLKRAIIDAAAAYGSDGKGSGALQGYLFFLAGKHPRAFSSLLGRLMPLQLDGHLASSVAQVNVVAIPADHFSSADDLAKLLQPSSQFDGVIEPIEPGHFLNNDVTPTDS